LITWLVVRSLRDGGRGWLLVGLVAGVGLENKLLPAVLLAALLLAAVRLKVALRGRRDLAPPQRCGRAPGPGGGCV